MARLYYHFQAHIEHTKTQAIVQWRELISISNPTYGEINHVLFGRWQSQVFNATPSNGGRDNAMRRYAALRDYMVVTEVKQSGKVQTSHII